MGVRGRFAVIKLWPELKTAEDECIERLKVTARGLGLECVAVDSFARTVEAPHVQLTAADVDFVLSLHFDTPKSYDIFSFVALWNPLQFFHEWGYRRCTRNLLSHDDFLSCSSPWADDHVRRSLANDPTREGPELLLYHSLSEPILPPTTGEGKLVYVGINWERVSGKPMRHAALLKLLDESGDLRIYGPRLFQGVDVWDGYKSYSGPIPFDGVSIVHEIHKAGVALVLSSKAHRESELMSSRLFETLAAGAVAICDDNPFVRRFFGDLLLSIDTSGDANKTYQQVRAHLEWIRSEPEKAIARAREAQQIFLARFSLNKCLQEIYRELPRRKQKLARMYQPKRREQISAIFLMPEWEPRVLERHALSLGAQTGVCIRAVLAIDGRQWEQFGAEIQQAVDQLPGDISVQTLDFLDPQTGRRRRIGRVISEAIERFVADDYWCIVAPHESLFSDHLCSLLHALEECETAGVAWADMLVTGQKNGHDEANLNMDPDPGHPRPGAAAGFGRFLFRKSALQPGFASVLPYLNGLAMDLILGLTERVPTRRCTCLAYGEDPSYEQFIPASPVEEREFLIDYAPSVFLKQGAAVADWDVDAMTSEQKQRLAVALAHSVPIPAFAEKIAFALYRFWLKRRNERVSSSLTE
jgi:hypothetical protein